jgi:hypothetical protein
MAARTVSKIYSGKLVKGRKQVSVRSDLTTAPLRCFDFFTPSFSWGYHGGAPDNLAISILQDYFGLPGPAVDARVKRLFSAFTDDLVSNFGHDDAWSLTAGRIAKWVSDHEEAMPRKVEPQVETRFDETRSTTEPGMPVGSEMGTPIEAEPEAPVEFASA